MSSSSSLERFGARLRELIRVSAGGAAGPAREFDELAPALFALQFKDNGPYRTLCEVRGVSPRVIEHWSQIPAVPTSAFKDLELTCLRAKERVAVFHSSGTTGQKPSRHYHCADSLALYRTALLRWFEAHLVPERGRLVGTNDSTTGILEYWNIGMLENSGRDLGNSGWKWLMLTPSPAQAPHSSLVYMFETIRQAAGAPESAYLGHVAPDGSWTVDVLAATKLIRQTAEEAQPVMVLGTAFSFVHWLDHLADRNLRVKLPPGSRALETGGYKGRSRQLPKAELHALITQHLSIPPNQIICEYGMSELTSQAYAAFQFHSALRIPHSAFPFHSALRIPRSAFQFPPWTRVQIISPESGTEVAEGETGLLRVFDLANVYSVMAIQTEDLAIRCGDGFELLGRAALAEPRGCSLMPA